MKTAVILAAGLGSRLLDITADKPKSFLQIGGISLIERSIKNLEHAGITRIIIGTGYMSHYFDSLKEKYKNVITLLNEKFDKSGSMFTLYKLQSLIDDNFLLLESDLLYEPKALDVLINHSFDDVILASGLTKSGDEVFIETDSQGFLNNMSKQTKNIKSIYAELVGISKISHATYQSMCSHAKNYYLNNKFEFHYEDVFVNISNEKKIFVEKIDDLIWCEIDNKNHLKRAMDLVYPKIISKNYTK